MDRRRFLAALAAVPIAGCGDPDEAQSPTATPEPTPTPTDEELATNAARSAADGHQYVEAVRSVTTAPDFRGRDGYLVEVRVDMDTTGLGAFGSRRSDAEHRGGTIARDVCQAVATADVSRARSAAIYAYVPTNQGDAVSTKVVVDFSRFDGVDWPRISWQTIRDNADQYSFSAHFYDGE